MEESYTAVGGNSPRTCPSAFNKKRKKKATRQEKWGSLCTNLRKKKKGNGRIERLLALGAAI
jgi:hypothetical protein